MARKESMVALLRGVNVTGKKMVSMAALRELAEKLRYEDVSTYVQSGNLLLSTDRAALEVESELEQAIERRFGFFVPVIVRTARAWRKFEKGSPFPDAERERPNVLYLGFSKRPPVRGALEALAERATRGERIVIEKGAIWIDFTVGVARSKITPVLLDRVVGSPVTLRNFRSVSKLGELLRQSAP